MFVCVLLAICRGWVDDLLDHDVSNGILVRAPEALFGRSHDLWDWGIDSGLVGYSPDDGT